jgi:predicted RNase H-like HicB family nuclease
MRSPPRSLLWRFGLSIVSAMTTRTLTAVVHKESNWFVAQCPETGTVSQGETIDSAVQNLNEATELYFEEFPQAESSRPQVTVFDVAVNA